MEEGKNPETIQSKSEKNWSLAHVLIKYISFLIQDLSIDETK